MSRSSTPKYRLAFGPDGNPRVRFVPATWQHRGRLREMSYVEFYVWDDVQQRVVRKRIGNFNGLTTTAEKGALAEAWKSPASTSPALWGIKHLHDMRSSAPQMQPHAPVAQPAPQRRMSLSGYSNWQACSSRDSSPARSLTNSNSN